MCAFVCLLLERAVSAWFIVVNLMAYIQEEKAFETVVDECSVKFAATARALHELLDDDHFDIEDAAKPFEPRNAGERGAGR